ncbi:hypothetical protein NVS55_05965 [Myxococcus stipitatus]|uniref:hypothetical protein n=1 Tax=Myxococcus stipitatus TaxID=83455 RepID=UPI0031454ABC
MRHATLVALLLLVSMPALAARREGSCEVRVTGGVQLAFTGKGGTQAAASDHWMSREERRQMFEKLYARVEKDPARRKLGVEQQMGPDGLMSGPLTVHCITAAGPMAASFSIFAGPRNTLESVPFKPGTYPLVSLEEKPGELGVSLRLKGINYKLSSPGVLVLTRFDGGGVAGTFQFTARTNVAENRAKAVMRNVHVTGSFDLPCLMKSRVCSK